MSERLTPQRIKAVEARLCDGYSEDDLSKAIRGYGASPWHQGKNPQAKPYNDFKWILQDEDHVENGITHFENIIDRPRKAQQEEARQELDEHKQREQEIARRQEIERKRGAPQKPNRECLEFTEDEMDEIIFGREDSDDSGAG